MNVYFRKVKVEIGKVRHFLISLKMTEIVLFGFGYSYLGKL